MAEQPKMPEGCSLHRWHRVDAERQWICLDCLCRVPWTTEASRADEIAALRADLARVISEKAGMEHARNDVLAVARMRTAERDEARECLRELLEFVPQTTTKHLEARIRKAIGEA